MGSDGLESAGLSEKLTRTISALGMVAAQEKSKIANKNTAIISFLFKIITLYSFWCPRSDSNRHEFPHRILSAARLPFHHSGIEKSNKCGYYCSPLCRYGTPAQDFARFLSILFEVDAKRQRLRPGGIPRFRFRTRRGLLLTLSRRFLPQRRNLVGFDHFYPQGLLWFAPLGSPQT